MYSLSGTALPFRFCGLSENQTATSIPDDWPSDADFAALPLPVPALSRTRRLQDFHLRRAGHVWRGGGVDGTHDAGRDQQGGKCNGEAHSKTFFDHDVLLSISDYGQVRPRSFEKIQTFLQTAYFV